MIAGRDSQAEPIEDLGPSRSGSRRTFVYALILIVELAALSLFQSPNQRFTRFAYNDSGADLTIPSLMDQGFRPTMDFGYIYGLLPLAINRAWQGIFGANPSAFRALALICNLLMVLGLARLLETLRSGLAGLALVVVAMPDLLQVSTIVLVHSLEPALLVNALAWQAKGRRDLALALATACLFVKPSMAYVYGLWLLILIFREPKTLQRLRNRVRELMPAILIGLGLIVLLGSMFGPIPLMNSIRPGAGLEVYRQGGYGFFRGAGQSFWWLPGGGLRDYFRFEVGSWIAGTLILTAAGWVAAIRMIQRKSNVNVEILATCSLMHLLFVTLFFGNRVSWIYYYAILIVGLMALSGSTAQIEAKPPKEPTRGNLLWPIRWKPLIVFGLALLILLGSKVKFETTAKLWRTDSPAASTLGLWSNAEERAEWAKVRELCENQGPLALLANVEGLAILAPELFPKPTVGYLVPGHPLPVEIARKADQLANAKTVVRVRPASDPNRGGFERWPELARALKGMETIWSGRFFEVERRRESAPTF